MSDLRDKIIDIIGNSRTAYISDHVQLPCSDEDIADEILKEMQKEVKVMMEAFGVD